MKGFVREQLLRSFARWDTKGSGLWRANPKKLVDSLLSNLSGARLSKQEKEEVSATVQGLVRHKLLLDHVVALDSAGRDCKTARDVPWPARLAAFQAGAWRELLHDASIPEHLRVSFPPSLYRKFQRRFGSGAEAVCHVSNEAPGLFLRVNPLVAADGRNGVLRALAARGVDAELAADALWGIRVGEAAVPVTQLREYATGAFEIQDESSQLVAELVACAPGDVVIDLCCGAGGKALALLGRLGGEEAKLVLHDVRPAVLQRAAARLRRAGASLPGNAAVEITASASELQRRWAGAADWALVDAPCSNSGSLRKHPECKYRLFEDEAEEGGGHRGIPESIGLEGLVATQRTLLRQAAELLKPGGTVVYSTCSVLPEENESQVEWAAAELGLLPVPGLNARFVGCFAPQGAGGRDGFFAAVLRR